MWTYDNQEFEDKEDVIEYVGENLEVMDELDLERYLDETYTAHEVYGLMRDCLDYDVRQYGSNGRNAVADDLFRTYYGIYEEAERATWEKKASTPEPIEGQDWEFDGELFKWVDDPEEEE